MSFLVFFTSALTVCVSPCLQPSRCQSLAHVVLFRLCMSCLASATSDLCMHHPCCVCLSVLRVCPVYLLFCTSASCMSNFTSGTQGLILLHVYYQPLCAYVHACQLSVFFEPIRSPCDQASVNADRSHSLPRIRHTSQPKKFGPRIKCSTSAPSAALPVLVGPVIAKASKSTILHLPSLSLSVACAATAVRPRSLPRAAPACTYVPLVCASARL